ncbi:unnamed protein product [Spirodela intermedia]|uniref:Uncharacterized protein n=1 Tax=Spirodela intermedia TaxID=51605 RepID=A0A7I8KVR6_SPIIN|nr:unnamed protein product [Spirodela intermedia]
MAFCGSTCPAPKSITVEALPVDSSSIVWPRLSFVYAVVIKADLIAAGLQPGCAALRSAARPETCGHAMDVPDRILNSVRRPSAEIPAGPTPSGQAAKMLSPGATTSGFKISGDCGLGPRAEKDATTGAGRTPNRVPRNTIVAVGARLGGGESAM